MKIKIHTWADEVGGGSAGEDTKMDVASVEEAEEWVQAWAIEKNCVCSWDEEEEEEEEEEEDEDEEEDEEDEDEEEDEDLEGQCRAGSEALRAEERRIYDW